MKTKFSKMAHHYMGCPIQFFPGAFGRRRLLGIIGSTAIVQTDENDGTPEETFDMDYDGPEKAKPILRRLESMTEEEIHHVGMIWGVEPHLNENLEGFTVNLEMFWQTTDYLYSLHMDLHGLIDSGEAIDQATVNNQ